MLDAPGGFDPFAPYRPREFEIVPVHKLRLAMYTDAHVIRGHVETRLRRITDVLNQAEHDFIVVSDASLEEFGAGEQAPTTADFAQVNLSSLLFAVSDTVVEAVPELRLVKSSANALIVVPPFKIVGRIHVLPEVGLREALAELTGHFVPVTDATYWSDRLQLPKTDTSFLAFNHARAQVLASLGDHPPRNGAAAGF